MKEPCPSSIRELGMNTFFIEEQAAKAFASIVVTPSGRFISKRDLQVLKALFPIFFKE